MMGWESEMGATGNGQRAWGMGHGAWSMELGAWSMELGRAKGNGIGAERPCGSSIATGTAL